MDFLRLSSSQHRWVLDSRTHFSCASTLNLQPETPKTPNFNTYGRLLTRRSHPWPKEHSTIDAHIGALISTYTILGGPYYKYSIMGTKTLF